jgi:hypothetical protein
VRAPVTLRLFVPSWTTNQRLTLNGRELRSWKDASGFAEKDSFVTVRVAPRAGDVFQYDFMTRVGPRDPLNASAMPGYHSFYAGPLLLGYAAPADPNAPAPTLRSPDPAEVHIPRKTNYGPTGSPFSFKIAGLEGILAPINDLHEVAATPRDPCPRQVLFREA